MAKCRRCQKQGRVRLASLCHRLLLRAYTMEIVFCRTRVIAFLTKIVETDSSDSQPVFSSGDEAEIRRGSQQSANTTSTTDDAYPKTRKGKQNEPLELGRELTPEDVKQKASDPALHQSSITSGFSYMTTSTILDGKPPPPPPAPVHQSAFPNSFPHERGHGRFSSPRAPDLPDLHTPGSERHPNVRNPVSDLWTDDAYEKPEATRVTKMSEIEARLNRWRCKCGVFNDTDKDTCRGCKAPLGTPKYDFNAQRPGEEGMRGNAARDEERGRSLTRPGFYSRQSTGLDGAADDEREEFTKKKKTVRKVPEFAEEA
ncbi:hypothetical protein BKA66DRAFT_447451 [Pyrenochaeta sp. MPI-SDFR-AT-0127]|nr:hypothetical protein BKA66DRAFT_447451 [Pyrenochaeta sp. MPI-SDFR-AT-0127]